MKTKTFCSMTARGLVAAAVAFAPFAGASTGYIYPNAVCNSVEKNIKAEGLKKVSPSTLLNAYHCTKDITYLKEVINRTDIEERNEAVRAYAKAFLACDYLDEIYKKYETNEEEFSLERETFEQLIEIYKLSSDALNYFINKENPSYPYQRKNAYYELDLQIFPNTLSNFETTERLVSVYVHARRRAKLPPFRALEKDFLNLKSENEELEKAIKEKHNNILENVLDKVSKKFDDRETLINDYKEGAKNAISYFNARSP